VTEREGRKDETGRRVEKGQGRGSPRAGGGRSTEMINASRSPPFVPFPRSTTYPRPPLPPSRLPTYLPPRPRSVALSKFSTGVRENALARPYNAPNALRGRNSLPPPPVLFARAKKRFIYAARRAGTSRIRSIDAENERERIRGQDTLTRVAGY